MQFRSDSHSSFIHEKPEFVECWRILCRLMPALEHDLINSLRAIFGLFKPTSVQHELSNIIILRFQKVGHAAFTPELPHQHAIGPHVTLLTPLALLDGFRRRLPDWTLAVSAERRTLLHVFRPIIALNGQAIITDLHEHVLCDFRMKRKDQSISCCPEISVYAAQTYGLDRPGVRRRKETANSKSVSTTHSFGLLPTRP